MENNVYEAPQSDVTTSVISSDLELASRWSRLGASILDSILLILALMPFMYGLGWFDILLQGEEPSLLFSLGMGVLGIIIFFAINIKFLLSNGQTVGKKLVNIKIVDMYGARPILASHLLKRYLTYFVPNQVPYIGGVFAFINVLFIFREDKRCIHDLLAGTQVVRCKQER